MLYALTNFFVFNTCTPFLLVLNLIPFPFSFFNFFCSFFHYPFFFPVLLFNFSSLDFIFPFVLDLILFLISWHSLLLLSHF